ncbi:hypothetical protein BC940DRAFT_315609 [Gongronella butleri]|nr:hypothetical protein BC940DRAFT_315609 [Gongronella butleri]
MFLGDVLSAKVQSNDPLTLQTTNNTLFRKVTVNGVIVGDISPPSGPRRILTLDDGTGSMEVHFSERACHRFDMGEIELSASITVIAEPRVDASQRVLVCKGFQVETDLMTELKHWMDVAARRKDTSQRGAHYASSMVDCSRVDRLDSFDAPPMDRQATMHSMFQSLSSQPSPIRGSLDFLESPTSSGSQAQSQQHSGASQEPLSQKQKQKQRLHADSPWHWSPDHMIATSTPVKLNAVSPVHASGSTQWPLRTQNVYASPLQQRVLPTSSTAASKSTSTATAAATTASSSPQRPPKRSRDEIDPDDDDFGFSDDGALDNFDFSQLEQGS